MLSFLVWGQLLCSWYKVIRVCIYFHLALRGLFPANWVLFVASLMYVHVDLVIFVFMLHCVMHENKVTHHERV